MLYWYCLNIFVQKRLTSVARSVGIVLTSTCLHVLTDVACGAAGAAAAAPAAAMGGFMGMIYGLGKARPAAPAPSGTDKYERWVDMPLASITAVHIGMDSQYVRIEDGAGPGLVLLTRSAARTRLLLAALAPRLSGAQVVKHRADVRAAIAAFVAGLDGGSAAEGDEPRPEPLLAYALVLRSEGAVKMTLRDTQAYGPVASVTLVVTAERCLLCAEALTTGAPGSESASPFRLLAQQPFEQLNGARVHGRSPEIFSLQFEATEWILLAPDTAERDRVLSVIADHWEDRNLVSFLVAVGD
jgi:hypothetical protein